MLWSYPFQHFQMKNKHRILHSAGVQYKSDTEFEHVFLVFVEYNLPQDTLLQNVSHWIYWYLEESRRKYSSTGILSLSH